MDFSVAELFIQPSCVLFLPRLQSWEQQRAGVRAAAAAGFGAGRVAPQTPPGDFMGNTSSSSCMPQPGVNRENFYAPNPLSPPMASFAALHAGGAGPMSSFASPGGIGFGGAAAFSPVLRSAFPPRYPRHVSSYASPSVLVIDTQSSRPAVHYVTHEERPPPVAASRRRHFSAGGGHGGARHEVK